jgi:uroporphyrinogen-III decarboxylase
MQCIDRDLSMTGRKRVQAALLGDPVDRMPVAPLYLDLYLAGEVKRQALTYYEQLVNSKYEVRIPYEYEAHIQGRAFQHALRSMDALPDLFFICSLLPEKEWLSECVLRKEEEKIWRFHLPSGCREELSGAALDNSESRDRWGDFRPAGEEDIRSLVGETDTEALLARGTLGGVEKLVSSLHDEIFMCGVIMTPWWAVYTLLGFQAMMEMPLQTPRLFHLLLERLLERQCGWVEAYQRIGVHGVFIEECMSSADLISPSMYDEFVFEYDIRLLDKIRATGLPGLMYTTGDAMPRLPRLKELQPDALLFEESKKNFVLDLEKIASCLEGRTALFGNTDATQVKEWDGHELNRQLGLQYEAGKNAKGFVFSTGSPFPLDTPQHKVENFIQRCHEFAPDKVRD